MREYVREIAMDRGIQFGGVREEGEGGGNPREGEWEREGEREGERKREREREEERESERERDRKRERYSERKKERARTRSLERQRYGPEAQEQGHGHYEYG